MKSNTTLATMGACHISHDGYSSSLYIFLPIWALSFNLTISQSGWLATIYVLAMGGLQLPIGLLAERLGERIVLVLGTLITASGFCLLGIAGGFTALLMLLFLAGAGSSVQHPLASSLVSAGFQPSKRKQAIAMYNFTGDLGKIAFPFLASLSLAYVTWQITTGILGCIGLVVAVVTYRVLSRNNLGSREKVTESFAASISDWGISDRLGFRLLSMIFAIDTFVRDAFAMLLPFILISKGMEMNQTGFALSLLFIGGAVGKFMFGYLASRIGSLLTVLVSEGITAICLYLVFILPLQDLLWMLPITGVFLNGTSSVLYGKVVDFVSKKRRTRAFSLFYTIGIVAGAFAPATVGMLSDAYGKHNVLLIIATLVLVTLPLALMMRHSLREEPMPV